MSLIDQVREILDRLAPLGWRDLLLKVSNNKLDIAGATAAKLAGALASGDVDRSIAGFGDFALGDTQGIAPGDPARSLIYHALASPAVLTDGSGNPLRGFPSLYELEIVENYIFAARKASLADIVSLANGQKLSIVVFACEYRTAKDTCSRLQAELAFSRTGISRVGTLPAQYIPERRGFWAENDADPFALHACGTRFVAYLAVAQRGSPSDFLPMRPRSGDSSLMFWKPLHKLFDGKECLKDVPTLALNWSATHINDKIRRIHVKALKKPAPTSFPFQFASGIAELSSDSSLGKNVVVPTPHPRLIEPAIAPDPELGYFSFKVPKKNKSAFAAFEPATSPNSHGEVRPAPAYIHARTRVERFDKSVRLMDMNTDPAETDVLAAVGAGDYEALHYVDFTGEGQVDVTCEALDGNSSIAGKSRPAYSLVSAPDFFPMVGQRELTEWTETLPRGVASSIWAVPPAPLCDVRLPANLQLPGISFDAKEVTMTAIVSLAASRPIGTVSPRSTDALRYSSLPDDAAGVFAPGWDVSQDELIEGTTKTAHLAAYGLGSPFPEDAKLCAALSTFWPAVAPDVARTVVGNVATRTGTVAPLSDEEIGQVGSLPWDGLSGPHVVSVGGQDFLQGPDFLHADYVEMALNNRFSIRVTARLSFDEYVGRVLAMARVYRAMPPGQNDRDQLAVISFRLANSGDPELQQAQSESGAVLPTMVFRVDLCRMAESQLVESDQRKARMPITGRQVFFVSPNGRTVLRRMSPTTMWSRIVVDF